LYDVGFAMTPRWVPRPVAIKVLCVDLLAVFCQVLPWVVLLLGGRTRSIVNYVGTSGVAVTIKAVFQLVTVLPPAYDGENCWEMNYNAAQLDTIRAGFGLWVFGPWSQMHGCNDMIYSGHTVNTTIGFLFLNRQFLIFDIGVCRYLRFILWPWLFMYVLTVLSCRMHYTIDVIAAIVVGSLLYTHSGLQASMWRLVNFLVLNGQSSGVSKV